MHITEYLSRMAYRGGIQANEHTLRELQVAHTKAVPFENLDISLGRKIQLDEPSLWEKIVINKRGGFCYELNGLFSWLLREVGFEVTHLNARAYRVEEQAFGIEFGHLTLMVQVPGQPTRWLVDVGWGDTFTEPLDIDNPD